MSCVLQTVTHAHMQTCVHAQTHTHTCTRTHAHTHTHLEHWVQIVNLISGSLSGVWRNRTNTHSIPHYINTPHQPSPTHHINHHQPITSIITHTSPHTAPLTTHWLPLRRPSCSVLADETPPSHLHLAAVTGTLGGGGYRQ